ncbi:hypothetical protein B0I35DRAFT_411798 [Stachybotrys elegans]|uniref:Kelch repeat protein n=1 Tax=Stachybotrys elegans TaxID=80388 RepID=A0A8K0SJ65_9HYPO|nr:hypothetical protein B0I35DRAFT_411798 [Stachybotrys elegans]
MDVFWARVVLVLLAAPSAVFSQRDVPNVDDFMRRGSSRISVIGDYIYFEGGEVSQGTANYRMNDPVNSTLSIDLSRSWRPSDVEIQEIPKPREMIRMTKQSIITNTSSGSFYSWGGHSSWFADIEAPVLWRFDTDGEGGGSWSLESAGSRSSSFVDIERTHSAAYASTPDAGFVFGGQSTTLTSLEPRGYVAGYSYWNLTTGEWNVDSSGPYTDDGTLYGGTATYVPTFGPNGIIVVLGGVNNFEAEASDTEYVDFRTVHFIDPVTRRWYSQPTTGGAPSARHYHCAAGAESTNGTFEIFIYGGANRLLDTDYRDIYVLSLPGFVWSQPANINSVPRSEHTCAVVGNRQLLSWGGLDFNDDDGWRSHDPFPQGLGIFDMSALEWSNEYDAEARPYEAHQRIRSWYDDGGMDNVQWSSSDVEQLFAVRQEDNGNQDNQDNPDDRQDGGDNQGNPPPDNSGGSGESSSVPVGAIAGGAVGGVVVLALLAFGVWFFLRRRRRAQQQQQQQGPQGYKPPPYYSGHPEAEAGKPSELPAAHAISELPANTYPVELGDGSDGRRWA